MRRRLQDLREDGPVEIAMTLRDLHLDALAGQSAGDEHGFSLLETQPLPAGNKLGNREHR
jgi:hypothetical protein